MNTFKNVVLPLAFAATIGTAFVAGCKRVPDVIKEVPTEQTDTMKNQQKLEQMANMNKMLIEKCNK